MCWLVNIMVEVFEDYDFELDVGEDLEFEGLELFGFFKMVEDGELDSVVKVGLKLFEEFD